MTLELAGVSIFIAFFAGLLSVASPCVLPLIPAYLGYLTGVSLEEPTPRGTTQAEGMTRSSSMPGSALPRTGVMTLTRPSPFLHAASFVSGFSLIFVAFGVSLGALGFLLRDYQDIIFKVAGSLLIVFGLHLSGIITIPWLNKEWRPNVGSSRKISYARSFFVGSAFSAGWSPCIGPTLGAILALAISSGTVTQASILLIAYSAGLAIPFLVMGLAFNTLKPLYTRIKRHLRLINYASGVLIIVIGILIFTDSLVSLNNLFNFGFLGDFAAGN